MIKIKSLRGFRWYRRLAGGSWRKIGSGWVPKPEVEGNQKRYGRERFRSKPWTMKPVPEQEVQQPPVPEPEQPVPSLAA